MLNAPIRIELTDDEALVLFDWLSRFGKSGRSDLKDQAEQRALWNLEAILEKNLDAVLDPRYHELVAKARERLRDPQM
jgi:hypothetical protein